MEENIYKQPVGFMLERTTRVVKLKFHRLFKDLGIDMTPEQWVMMDSLYQNNDQSQKDLANGSFKDAPTISRIIDVLEKKGWVVRNPSPQDRRIYIIHQTEEGHQLTKNLLEKVQEIRLEGWSGLDMKDYQEFTRIINKVFENYSL